MLNVRDFEVNITSNLNIDNFDEDFALKSSAKALKKEFFLYCIVDGKEAL